jgi:hypothetical protein
MNEEFSVCQFFPDQSYEYVCRFVSGEQAATAFNHCCTSVGARYGIIVRVIITDGGDYIVAEWERGKGLTYPLVSDGTRLGEGHEEGNGNEKSP